MCFLFFLYLLFLSFKHVWKLLYFLISLQQVSEVMILHGELGRDWGMPWSEGGGYQNEERSGIWNASRDEIFKIPPPFQQYLSVILSFCLRQKICSSIQNTVHNTSDWSCYWTSDLYCHLLVEVGIFISHVACLDNWILQVEELCNSGEFISLLTWYLEIVSI